MTDGSAAGILRCSISTRAPAVFLHLCSGRRREGDVQYWLERLAGEASVDVLVVSVDPAIDRVRGNAAHPDNVGFWLHAIWCGVVVGLLEGPPCETWSQSRYGDDTVEVLRALDTPWGRSGLKPRQYAQLRMANILLHVGLLFLVATQRSDLKQRFTTNQCPAPAH